MIAIDTSVIVAIALEEPESARFDRIISSTDAVLIGLPTLFEARMVLTGRFGPVHAHHAVTMLVEQWQAIPFGMSHLTAAADAFDRYGKGRHPARLNYGDCMAYAVAKVAGCPLLYKGDDFAVTDIPAAA